MTIDRKKLLERRIRLRGMIGDNRLSQETRSLAKRAMDHAEVALGLDSAIRRRKAAEAAESSQPAPSRDEKAT